MNAFNKMYVNCKRSAALGCCILLMGLYTTAFARPVAPTDPGGPIIPSQVKVFKSDQSTQCDDGSSGIPLAVMYQELINAGVAVQCAQKGHTGSQYPAVCGGATGVINIYSINRRDYRQALRLGFAPVSSLPDYEDAPCLTPVPLIPQVFKYDGSTQCNKDGIPVKLMGEELLKAGIDIKCAHKAQDGLHYPTVCDGPTGTINVYEIHPENIPDAQRLGFESVSSLSEYQYRPCRLNPSPSDR